MPDSFMQIRTSITKVTRTGLYTVVAKNLDGGRSVRFNDVDGLAEARWKLKQAKYLLFDGYCLNDAQTHIDKTLRDKSPHPPVDWMAYLQMLAPKIVKARIGRWGIKSKEASVIVGAAGTHPLSKATVLLNDGRERILKKLKLTSEQFAAELLYVAGVAYVNGDEVISIGIEDGLVVIYILTS